MRKSVAAIAFLLPTALAFGAEVQPPRQEEGKYANPLMNAPVSHLIPGAIPFGPTIKNPLASDTEAAMRGMNDFINFNCVGCHAPNGGGGMGPSHRCAVCRCPSPPSPSRS